MHELGIVKHVIKTVSDIAAENGISRVIRVTLTVGEVSGVVEYQMLDCWDWFSKKTELVRDCVLTLETLPAVTWCTACKREYGTVKYGRTCPFCSSPETYLLRGNECIIKEIEGEQFPWISS